MNKKVLNYIMAGLMVFLLIPTTAILASNNALPGDTMYSVKTTLENLASTLTSSSYQAHSELEIKLIQRRIEENQKLLLSSGSTRGLELLVAQAEAAKEYILNSSSSQQVKTEAVNNLVRVLKESQNKLEEQKQNIASTNTVYKTVYKTKIVYKENPTVSQGNSQEQTTTPDDTQDTAKQINDTQDSIEDMIDDLTSQSNEVPENPDTPSLPPAPEPTPEPISDPDPAPESTNDLDSTPTFVAPTYSSCEEACDVLGYREGRCKTNQSCFGNVSHNTLGDQFCDSRADKICCCELD